MPSSASSSKTVERDQHVLQVPAVGGLGVLVGELAELLADHVEGLVAQGEVAEVPGVEALGDQLGEALAHAGGVAGRDQLLDGRGAEGLDRLFGDAHVGGSHDLDLAEGDAALELVEVLAVGGLEDQPLQFAQAALGVEAFGPAQDLAQADHVGRQPGVAVGGELLALQEGRVDLAAGRDPARDGALGRGLQRFGLDPRRAAELEQVGEEEGAVFGFSGQGFGHCRASFELRSCRPRPSARSAVRTRGSGRGD